MLKKPAHLPVRLSAVRVRQLRLFALAAEVGSISEAACRCHVTQPSATEMLHDLERAFSHQLFVRGSKGIVLAPAGARVKSFACVSPPLPYLAICRMRFSDSSWPTHRCSLT